MSDDDAKPNPAAHLKPHQFEPGRSGNPAGRAKGLEKRTRDLIGDDIDGIIYVQRCVALGVPPDPEQMIALGVALTDDQKQRLKETFDTITRRDVNEAAKLVCDRGWGKAKEHVDVTDKTRRRMPKNMPAMTDEQLRIAAMLDDGLEGVEDDELDDGPGNGATQH